MTDTEQAGAQAGGVMTTQFYVRTGPGGEFMPTDAPQVEIARIRKSLDNAMASRIEWRRLAEAAEARALAAETALAARDVATDAVPVGVVGAMPGTSGFTMAVFRAEEVPVGTPLYASPTPPAPAPEASE